MNNRFAVIACSLFLLLALTACGGGGGGDGSSATPPPVNGKGNGSSVTPPPSNNNVAGFAYVAEEYGGGIHAYTIDTTTGAFSEIGSSSGAAAFGSHFVVAPNGKFAYQTAIQPSEVLGYSVNAATGALTSVGPPVTTGAYPSTPSVDPSGRFLYVPNANAATISAYAIDADTGVLSEIAGSPFATASGPGSIAVAGKYLYVAASQISIYNIDPTTGALAQIPDSPIEVGVAPTSIAVHPAGRFLYVANAAIDSAFNPFCFVRAYAIDVSSGALSLVPGTGGRVAAGDSPSDMVLDPSGRFVYVSNIDSNNVSAYTINSTNGGLIEVPGSPFAGGGFGVRAIGVDPTGKFVYLGGVTGSKLGDLNGWVQAYTIEALSGALTPIGAPMRTGQYVSSISTMRATR